MHISSKTHIATFSLALSQTPYLQSAIRNPPAIMSSRVSDNVTDFVINQGHGVKGLVDAIGHHGLLPQQYVQPPEKRLDKSKVVVDESIPIIDLSNWDDPLVEESICDAAEKRGFFQIINHGVPIEVLQDVQDAAHRFFEQSTEEKMKYLKESTELMSIFGPRAEDVLDWKDYLCLLYVSEDDVAPSKWWPPICKNQVLEYVKRCEIVLEKLLMVLMKGLNVKLNDETKNLLMGTIRVNINYYPICPKPELAIGVGRHSDVAALTILLQDDTGGLYVRGTQGDTWIHVVPISGSLVINIGDALQILSNGRYKSIEHFAIPNGNKSRVSVPIFANPGSGAVIGPLSELLENGEAPLYKQVLFSDYFKYFFSKGRDGKKTIEFAKI